MDSPNKTVSMTFRKKRNNRNHADKQNITFKESAQFLGMTIDRRLNWKEHINNLRTKAKRALNTIRKKWGDLKTLKKIVQCNIQDEDGLWLPTI